METKIAHTHLDVLWDELEWLSQIIKSRAAEFDEAAAGKDDNQVSDLKSITEIQAPRLNGTTSPYIDLLTKHKFTAAERLVLILSLCPYLDPDILEPFAANQTLQRLAKISLVANQNSIMPTAGTALFLLAGTDRKERHKYFHLFDVEHVFYTKSILELLGPGKAYTEHQHLLIITQSYRDLLIHNKHKKPRFSEQFPAHSLETNLEWDDLLLMPETRTKLNEVKARLRHYKALVQDHGMRKHAKPGCRILFFGESGTGKTLSATLLGKLLGQEVFRVDLSQVTSKYIGETAKRLNSLFNTAESKNWILFFDEGDALMGQRKATDQQSNSSQYANQDTAFLLQRIERYDGIVIVATNMRSNIDQAFTRRFEVSVRFEAPSEEMQWEFWQENLPPSLPLSNDAMLSQWIKMHPLTPAAIISVIYRASILSLDAGKNHIEGALLLTCIRDEELKYKGRQGFAR